MSNDAIDGWKMADTANQYLHGTRAAIPLVREQMAVITQIVKKAKPALNRFLDLGCGDAVLGATLQNEHPQSFGLYVDFSETMRRAAEQRLAQTPFNYTIAEADFSTFDWMQSVAAHGPFDVIISGFSIHHQPDDRKREVYREIFSLLAPGGLFLNLEHVASPTPWVSELFESSFIDHLVAYNRAQGESRSRDDLSREWFERREKELNILAPVETQLHWLRELGYADVDCYFKLYELALFGGRRL